MKPSEIASLSNSRKQNRKERPNRSTNNGDMDEKAKRLWVSVWHLSYYGEAELLKLISYVYTLFDPNNLFSNKILKDFLWLNF